MLCKNCGHEVVINEEEVKTANKVKIIRRVYHVFLQNGYKCISNNCRPNNCGCIYPEIKNLDELELVDNKVRKFKKRVL